MLINCYFNIDSSTLNQHYGIYYELINYLCLYINIPTYTYSDIPINLYDKHCRFVLDQNIFVVKKMYTLEAEKRLRLSRPLIPISTNVTKYP